MEVHDDFNHACRCDFEYPTGRFIVLSSILLIQACNVVAYLKHRHGPELSSIAKAKEAAASLWLEYQPIEPSDQQQHDIAGVSDSDDETEVEEPMQDLRRSATIIRASVVTLGLLYGLLSLEPFDDETASRKWHHLRERDVVYVLLPWISGACITRFHMDPKGPSFSVSDLRWEWELVKAKARALFSIGTLNKMVAPLLETLIAREVTVATVVLCTDQAKRQRLYSELASGCCFPNLAVSMLSLLVAYIYLLGPLFWQLWRYSKPSGYAGERQRVIVESRGNALWHFKRLWRPKIASRWSSIDWTCSCGRDMYGDVFAKSREAVTSLAQTLKGSGRSNSHASSGQASLAPTGPASNSNSQAGQSKKSKKKNASSNVAPSGGPSQSSNTNVIANPSATQTEAKLPDNTPAYLELCVSRGWSKVSLGEIILVDANGSRLVRNDCELFRKIRHRYTELARRGLDRILYRPTDIHFVLFDVPCGGSHVGIYEDAIPPEEEVRAKRYHYFECPLVPIPPIDRRTFFHMFWVPSNHPPSASSNAGTAVTFFNRLPKKLGSSILMQAKADQLNLGWGLHIIEGPNKPLLAWLLVAIICASFVVSLTYDLVTKTRDSGFRIGQWMIAVLTAILGAVYFHMEDLA